MAVAPVAAGGAGLSGFSSAGLPGVLSAGLSGLLSGASTDVCVGCPAGPLDLVHPPHTTTKAPIAITQPIVVR